MQLDAEGQRNRAEAGAEVGACGAGWSFHSRGLRVGAAIGVRLAFGLQPQYLTQDENETQLARPSLRHPLRPLRSMRFVLFPTFLARRIGLLRDDDRDDALQ